MDLHDYLGDLKALNQLSQIEVAVDTDLELAALCREEFRKPGGGNALLFKSVRGKKLPVIGNMFGSEARALRMLHCESFEQLAGKLRRALAVNNPEKSCFYGQLLSQADTDLKVSEAAIDLRMLPAIRSWPGETGHYLTLALTVTRHLETGEVNVGLYRGQILNDQQIALNFSPGSGADQHLQVAQQLKQSLPVAMLLGCAPAYLWGAAAPLPKAANEFEFCAQAFDIHAKFVNCNTQELFVPADAELVLEGAIDPQLRCKEGPFGNHTGQYVSRNDCPLLKVTGIMSKPQALIPQTVVGPPPSENIMLAKINEVLIRELLRTSFPQISNLKMPLMTIFHGACLLTVQQQSNSDNRLLIEGLWQESPLSRSKLMILLDEDIDLEAFSQCWWRTVNRLDSRYVYQDKGRLAIDATGVNPKYLVTDDQATLDLLRQRSSEYKR